MENLRFIDIKKNKKYINGAKELYNKAFPKNEQVPFFMLKFLARKGRANFYSIYDDDTFIGLIYIVYYEDIIFVFYLAIDESLRGRGYGSKILDEIKKKYKEYRIVLNIEEIDENSNNNAQRIRRKEFYIRNGFITLDYTVKELNIIYEMLCYSNDEGNKYVSKEEYNKLLNNFFGDFLYGIIYKKNR